jgi:hypothetical protein
MSVHEQVHVIGHDLQRHDPPATITGPRIDQLRTPARGRATQNQAAIHRAPHDVTPQVEDATCGNLHVLGHAGDYTHRLCQTTRFRRRPKTVAPSRGA